MNWYLIQIGCFYLVLIFTSILDVKTHTVSIYSYLSLLVIGLMNPSLSALEGLLITLIPLLITGLIIPNRLGGGDIKFGALCGLVLTGTGGLTALFYGCVLCLLIVPVACKLLRQSLKGIDIPFIPFLSIGCVIATLI